MKNRVRRQYAILPCVLLLILLMGLPTLFLPFGRDQGFFAEAAWIINEGGDIYADAWDVKPPGIIWTYALFQKFFGNTMLAAHLADLLCVLVTASLLFLLMNILFPPHAGTISAVVYGFWYFLRTDYWSLAQAESFMGMWLAAAALTFLIASRRNRMLYSMVGGAFVAVGFLYKPTAALFALSSPLIFLLLSEKRSFRQSLCLVLASAAGFIVLCLGVLSWNTLSGSPAPLLDAYTVVIPGFMKMTDVGKHGFLSSNLHFFGQHWWLTLFALIGLGASLLRKQFRQVAVVAGLALLVLTGVWLQQKYYLYHWIVSFGFLSCLAGLGIHAFVTFLGKRNQILGYVSACAALLVLAIGMQPMVPHYIQQTKLVWMERTGKIDRLTFEKHFGDPEKGDFYLPHISGLAGWLKKSTPPGTPIFLWGFDPLLYFLADRPPASRFLGAAYVYSEWTPPAWRKELPESLRQKKPAFFIVDVKHDFYWMTGNHLTGLEALNSFPEITQMLEKEYEEQTDFGPYRIYSLKIPPASL